MFKFISILIAAIPLFLFLRAIVGRSTVMKRAVSDLRRQIDYLVWVLLFVMAAAMIYSAATLLYPLLK
jgi:hypothetical protein